MPYRRYDLKNRYNNKGQRVSGSAAFNGFLLIIIPFLIVLILVSGVLISFFSEYGSLDLSYDNIYDANSGVTDEELLKIVNINHPLEADYVPPLTDYDGFDISPVMEEELDRLLSDAHAQGIDIEIASAYVSYDEQSKLYDATFKNFIANDKYSEIKAESETRKICPQSGCSEGQTGLLIKFKTSESKGDFSKTKAYSWLGRYAVNYGFILRYPEGEEVLTDMNFSPETYRYVSKDHALSMRRYDMTLEEYKYHYSYY